MNTSSPLSAAASIMPAVSLRDRGRNEGCGSRRRERRTRQGGDRHRILARDRRGDGETLARDGYAVTVNCVKNRDLAANAVRDIEAAGGRAIRVQADVSDPAAVRRLFDACERAFGGVDVAFANAGIMRLAPIRDMRTRTSSDIADAIAALCSADGAWIDGQTVFANGGLVQPPDPPWDQRSTSTAASKT